MITKGEIHIPIKCDPDSLVWGNPDRLKICFRVLIDNSWHWCTKQDANIRLEVYKVPSSWIPLMLDNSVRYALMFVEDNGPGILEDDENRIYDLGFSRPLHRGGSGVGLSIVKRIADAHKGMVISVGKQGHRAGFAVFLPLAQQLLDGPGDYFDGAFLGL